jgi:hypothetical protein
VAGAWAAEDLVDEAAIGAQLTEVAGAAQQQGVLHRLLDVAMGAFDRAASVGDAAVVAGRLHAVVRAQGFVAHRQVLARAFVQVAEGRRQAVGAMAQRRPAQGPPGVLQPFGQGDIALPAQDDMGVLEARIDQAEVVEPVIEQAPGDGHRRVGHVGEVRQPHAAGLMRLAEDDLLGRAVQRPPHPDAPLEGPAHTLGQLGVTPPHLLENPERPQPRRRYQQRHDLGIEYLRQRVGPSTATRHRPLRRRQGLALQAIGPWWW